MKTATAAALTLLASGTTSAIDLDTSSRDSIISAAQTISSNILSYYNDGNGSIPGLFPPPYYWWEAGLTWDSLINYWYLTDDDSYNDIIHSALTFQLGQNRDYMPANQTKTLGNDDQAFWALAAMTAAETGFAPPETGSWMEIASRVFDEQVARWDADTCRGGLRWQIFPFNNGYNYKNSISQGTFFELASRLALFTENGTYYDWAQKSRQWMQDVGLVVTASRSNRSLEGAGIIWDGTDVNTNCSKINRLQWTANTGTFLSGSSYLANYSQTLENTAWPGQLFLRANASFANTHANASANNTLTEVSCAPEGNCNTDHLAYRSILARAIGSMKSLVDDVTYQFIDTDADYDPSDPEPGRLPRGNETSPAPSLYERIDVVLQTSAKGAAAQCSGGDSGTVCGNDWGSDEWDGTYGLGQDLSALNVILALLPRGVRADANTTATMMGGDGNGSLGNGTATSGGDGGDSTEGNGLPASTGGAARVGGSLALLGGLGAVFAVWL